MRARLITLRFSHYCEKARWALDRAAVAYDEDAHVPILSWRASFGAGGGRTVPVLVAPGVVLSDSTDIARWAHAQRPTAGLFPGGAREDDVAALEDEADRRLGPATRRLAYHALFETPVAARRLVLSGGPAWERGVGRVIYPLLRSVIRRGLKVEDAAAARSRAVVDTFFGKLEARLADGRPYLTGDTFTAADLTCAALAAPILLPPAYAAGALPAGTVSVASQEMVERYRATAAGRWLHDLFERERRLTA